MSVKEEWDYVDDDGVGYKVVFQKATGKRFKRVVWKSSILPSWKDVCWWSDSGRMGIKKDFKREDIEQLEEQILNYPHWE